ncbi:HAD-IC family P-type ATPase, partial [Candidatus Woesearchaeota archaeon]|nr:HAD-IC family P-type ATPase [Candidatus Woesearchaeota archaeon]
MAENYHALTVKDVLKLLDASEKGLTDKEAKKRLEKFGYNELEKGKRTPSLVIFINQFKNALLLLLIFAGVLSLFIGEKLESIAIFCILLLNAILGFIQEYRAEKAIEALQKISAPTARVMRDGKQVRIPSKEVVPGDILLLEAGDIVAADSRLIELSSLQIDEASLTGESIPSKKFIEPLKKGISVADQENMAFMDTIVTYGKGRSIVTGTGMRTEFGKIAGSLQETKEVQTPLQLKFAQLAKQIGIITVILIIIVLVSGILQGTPFVRMLLFALALTVSTIPNSLPLVVTVGLSVGTKKLAKKNMLVKELPAAESLGAATIICSDKTGTITQNQMTITHLFANDEVINVSGSGYDPKGNFSAAGKPVNPRQLELLLRIGYLCNNAKLQKNGKKYGVIGDPTEGSLIVLGRKGRLEDKHLLDCCRFREVRPFESDRRLMSVCCRKW